MSLEEERVVIRLACRVWNDGDLEGLLDCFTDDIVYTVNVDGQEVPYAGNTVGKDQMRARLLVLLDNLVVNAFVIESLVHEKEFSRAMVLGYYRHKRTGERLDVKIRFRFWVKDGLITRMEENHDAPYVEAFQRFVRSLELK